MSRGFEYKIPGYSDEWEEIDGYDHEDAALEAGKKYNQDGDFALMNDSIYVLVREVGSGDVKICYASAEPDIHYSSGECRSVTCNQCHKDQRPMIMEGKLPYDDRFCSKECYQAHIAQYRRENGLDKPVAK